MSLGENNIEFVSIHVPKAGGTSMRFALDGHNQVSTYYYRYDILEGSNVLHGHIKASKARRDFPKAKIFSIMRHPYGQIRSNYSHYLNHPGTEFEPGIGRLPTGMTIEDFITYEPLRNYQHQFLDTPIDYTGRLENIDESVKDIENMFSIKIGKLGKHNKTSSVPALDSKQKKLVDQYHLMDLELYHDSLNSRHF